ncbi:Neutral cholesterol ester hydrolase 1 [Madurella mycetomatis]|uniref:Neutral cholesterol ester hydrolase 1 n=1 Tax=Madurella mycetomatis TaxID=100816 RepID=A0A175WCM8_9PEZI|nr:Neutral cholesterol ester hydrolase 1 [Madurella mycetomatis]
MRCATFCHAKQAIILEYSLAPKHLYPEQLVQWVSVLRYLIEDGSVQPGDVILTGDSAGGHGQFRAALLVSPFTRLLMDAKSYESNAGKDHPGRA